MTGRAASLACGRPPAPLLFSAPALEAGALVVEAGPDTVTFVASRPELVAAATGGRRTEAGVVAPRSSLPPPSEGRTLAHALAEALAHFEAPRPRPLVMGIVNVTPDSFSDGGRFLATDAALAHGAALVAEGADVLDVGGESTRPGAPAVGQEEELRRVLPVVEGLSRRWPEIAVSIDTTKAAVAREAVAAGARIVNDVSAGLEDARMLPTIAELGVEYVAMHRQGKPADMQADPRYDDALVDVAQALARRVEAVLDAGIQLPRITLDPGIGFGKRLPHNLALLARTDALRSLGLPLLVGPSRKSFIGHVMGAEKEQDWTTGRRSDRPEDRLGGTAAAVTQAVLGGARVVRVHDVAMMVEATRVAEALARARDPRPR